MVTSTVENGNLNLQSVQSVIGMYIYLGQFWKNTLSGVIQKGLKEVITLSAHEIEDKNFHFLHQIHCCKPMAD